MPGLSAQLLFPQKTFEKHGNSLELNLCRVFLRSLYFLGKPSFGKLILLLFHVDPLPGVFISTSCERLGKQIFALFHVDPLFGVSLDISWERLGKQILSLFHVDPLSGVPLDISWDHSK